MNYGQLGKRALWVGLAMSLLTLARADTFTVTNVADSGPGTLREAILSANALPGPHVIGFSIGTGQRTIEIETALPAVQQPTLIDGTTQPGYRDRPLIELEGTQLGVSGENGLTIEATDVTVRGLSINRFGGAGVRAIAAHRVRIENCHLGIGPGGFEAYGNNEGVSLDACNGARVTGNLIGNNGLGIYVYGGTEALVQGNFIGFGFAGDAPLGNLEGVVLEGASAPTVLGNLIGNSAGNGIALLPMVQDARLEGNLIGINLFWDPAPNGFDGISVTDAPRLRLINNGIYLNWGAGIRLSGFQTTTGEFKRNDVLANAVGLRVEKGAKANVGTGLDEDRNAFSGNLTDGITIADSALTVFVYGNDVENNGRFGVAAHGALGTTIGFNRIRENALNGVFVGRERPSGFLPSQVRIRENIVSGNGDLGIRLERLTNQGANASIAAPSLVEVLSDGVNTSLTGNFVGKPSHTYTVEVFTSSVPDDSGFGEGERLLGKFSVTTSAGGAASLSHSFAADTVNQYVSATITDAVGNTSEFSNARAVGAENPLPVLSSVDPVWVPVRTPGMILQVTGDRFVPASKVQWNGTDLETQYISEEQLAAVVPEALLTTAGGYSISVRNPEPAGGTSNFLPFEVRNPSPALGSLSPASVLVGSGATTVTLTGDHFGADSVVLVDGQAMATEYVSLSQLRVTLSQSQLTSAREITFKVRNPEPGGGESVGLTFTVLNPVPVLTSVDPGVITAGSGDVTIRLTGTGFVASTRIFWDREERLTTVVSSTEVTTKLFANDLDLGRVVQLRVENGGPGGGSSNSLTVTIQNPIPAITSITPVSLYAGSSAVVMVVQGSGFVRSTVGRFHGADRETTYISGSEIRFVLDRADLALPGNYLISARNPSPGGGTSNTATLQIIGIPQIAIGPTSIARLTTLRANIVLRNIGTATATNLKVTKALLDRVATTTALPITLGSLNAGTQTGLTVHFPTSIPSGSRVLSLTLTYQGGAIFVSRKVIVP